MRSSVAALPKPFAVVINVVPEETPRNVDMEARAAADNAGTIWRNDTTWLGLVAKLTGPPLDGVPDVSADREPPPTCEGCTFESTLATT